MHLPKPLFKRQNDRCISASSFAALSLVEMQPAMRRSNLTLLTRNPRFSLRTHKCEVIAPVWTCQPALQRLQSTLVVLSSSPVVD